MADAGGVLGGARVLGGPHSLPSARRREQHFREQRHEGAAQEEVQEGLLQAIAARQPLCEVISEAPPEKIGLGRARVIEQRGRIKRGRAGIHGIKAPTADHLLHQGRCCWSDGGSAP